MAKFCTKCGRQLLEYTSECASCGQKFDSSIWYEGTKKWNITFLLGIFGFLGLHRFYTGYTLIGLIQLLTLGGLGIWWIIDLISIITNNFKDAEGNALSKSA